MSEDKKEAKKEIVEPTEPQKRQAMCAEIVTAILLKHDCHIEMGQLNIVANPKKEDEPAA